MQRFWADDLDEVFRGARSVVIAKGKKTVEFAPGTAPLGAALRRAALGPSGNLRAPTVRRGDRWLVGFHDEAWATLLG